MSETTRAYDTLRPDLLEDGTLLRIVLDKPKGNVLDSAMMGELSAVLEEHQEHGSLRLVVLRGAGGNFSYGASVEEHRKDQAPRMLSSFHALIRRLAGYPVPVAALVEGQCLGGGFELALACHLLFATPGARMGCPEIKLAVFPPVLAAIGARQLGGPVADRMVLTGATIDAAEAERLGLLTAVFEEGDAEQALLAWYRENLAPLSAFALRQASRAAREGSGFLAELDRALETTERMYLEEILPSHDGNEGIEAFLERRRARWRNR